MMVKPLLIFYPRGDRALLSQVASGNEQAKAVLVERNLGLVKASLVVLPGEGGI